MQFLRFGRSILVLFFLATSACSLYHTKLETKTDRAEKVSYQITSVVRNDAKRDCSLIPKGNCTDVLTFKEGELEKFVTLNGGKIISPGELLGTVKRPLVQEAEFKDCDAPQTSLQGVWYVSSYVTFGIIPYWYQTKKCLTVSVRFPDGREKNILIERKGLAVFSIALLGWGPTVGSTEDRDILKDMIKEIPAALKQASNADSKDSAGPKVQ